MSSIIRMKLASSVTRLSGMTRREWWCVIPQGRIASYSGWTEVFVDGASTASLPRWPSASPTLLDPDVGLAHHLLPAGEIGADLLGELSRRVRDGLDAERRIAAADVRLAEHRRDVLLQPLERLARCLRGGEDAGPGIHHESVEAAFDESRHVGERRRALRGRDAQAFQLAAAHELLCRGDRGIDEGNLAAHHV